MWWTALASGGMSLVGLTRVSKTSSCLSTPTAASSTSVCSDGSRPVVSVSRTITRAIWLPFSVGRKGPEERPNFPRASLKRLPRPLGGRELFDLVIHLAAVLRGPMLEGHEDLSVDRLGEHLA